MGFTPARFYQTQSRCAGADLRALVDMARLNDATKGRANLGFGQGNFHGLDGSLRAAKRCLCDL